MCWSIESCADDGAGGGDIRAPRWLQAAGTPQPSKALAAMHPNNDMHSYSETLARRIVADVARITGDPPMRWVMLHEVARSLKVDEASAEAAMHLAVACGWLTVEGSSLYRVCRTDAGRALPAPR
jgi:hypothetical protein